MDVNEGVFLVKHLPCCSAGEEERSGGSQQEKLKSDLFVGTGPGCRYLGRQVTFNYLSSYAVDLEASLLRLDEDGVEGHAGKRLALENSY